MATTSKDSSSKPTDPPTAPLMTGVLFDGAAVGVEAMQFFPVFDGDTNPGKQAQEYVVGDVSWPVHLVLSPHWLVQSFTDGNILGS